MRRPLECIRGPRVEIALKVADGLPAITGDANQVELALTNLALSARDARPEGDLLTVAPGTRDVAQDSAGLTARRYVAPTVSNTGRGMDAETLRRATEPCFSSKARGSGNGARLVDGPRAGGPARRRDPDRQRAWPRHGRVAAAARDGGGACARAAGLGRLPKPFSAAELARAMKAARRMWSAKAA